MRMKQDHDKKEKVGGDTMRLRSEDFGNYSFDRSLPFDSSINTRLRKWAIVFLIIGAVVGATLVSAFSASMCTIQSHGTIAYNKQVDQSTSHIEVQRLTNNDWDDSDAVVDIDSKGNPHVAWVTTHGAYYAVKSGGSWSTTQIITNPPILGYVFSVPNLGQRGMISLCLDSQDRPHIAWSKPMEYWSNYPVGVHVFYSCWNGNEWLTEQVTKWGTSATEGARLALALDSNDKPHIVWDSRVGLWGVFYSQKTGADWTFEVIGGNDEYHPNIAIDQNDVPHVVWNSGPAHPSGTATWYSSRIGDKWTTPELMWAGGSDAQGLQRLDVDSCGNPHVVIGTMGVSGPPFQLWYGRKSSDSWEFTEIDVVDEDKMASFACITLTAGDLPCIVWSRGTSSSKQVGDIYLAEYEQQKWTLHSISSQPFDEGWPKMAINSRGDVHIVWHGPERSAEGEAEIYHAKASKPISAFIDIDPDTLNLESNGKWITCYIELPQAYAPSQIDITSILLNNAIVVDSEAPTQIGDYDIDGISDLMVKFDWGGVIAWLGTSDLSSDTSRSYEVQFAIAGKVAGVAFQGMDTVRSLLTD